MEVLGLILVVVGTLIGFIYGIILLIKAFQVSILWGLASLLIPFAILVFVILNWEVAKKPFLMSLLIIPFNIVGFMLAPGTFGA